MTVGRRRCSRHPWHHRQRGQASVELALVLPVLAVLALVLAEVGLVVKDYVLVVHAAREALRAAVVEPTQAAVDRAVAGTTGPARGELDAKLRRYGDRVTVEVSYRRALNVPIVRRKIRDFSATMQVTGQVED